MSRPPIVPMSAQWRPMRTAPKNVNSLDLKYRILVKTAEGAIHVVRWAYTDVEDVGKDWCVAPDLGYIEGGWHHTCVPIGWMPLPPV